MRLAAPIGDLGRWAAGRALPPGAYAMAIATGIVSVAIRGELHGGVAAVASAALAALAGTAWVALSGLRGARLLVDAAAVRAELADPTTSFDCFAFVAATEVLGVRAALAGWEALARVAWVAGALAWLALLVALPRAWRGARPPGGGGTPRWWAASGNWLLAVVATQSLAVLGAALAVLGGTGRPAPPLPAVACCWLLGLLLYGALCAVIAARVRAPAAPPKRFTPDDWIVMGALAISTLAATQLLRAEEARQAVPARLADLPLAHATAAVWALASAAIVPLAVLQARRWWRERVARHYQTRWWAAVFPLGMYSVASDQLGAALRWPWLRPVARVALAAALAAWALTAAGAVGVCSPRDRRSRRCP